MNNTFSLQQISRTSNVDSIFVSRQYTLLLMADLMRMKLENRKLKQSEIANQRNYSCSILQRNRNDVKGLSPYGMQPKNTNKRTKKRFQIQFLVTIHVVFMTSKNHK